LFGGSVFLTSLLGVTLVRIGFRRARAAVIKPKDLAF